MKLVLGVYDYPPHPYHYQFIDDTWTFSDIHPRNPRIEKIDATDIPYRKLEAIYASHVLEHIYDTRTTLKHWRACLKRGGYVHINVPDMVWALDNICEINAGRKSLSTFYNSVQKSLEVITGTMQEPYDKHLSWFTEARLRTQLEEAGFKNIKTERVYESHLMGCIIAYATK